jgi:hypothetical protein
MIAARALNLMLAIPELPQLQERNERFVLWLAIV